MPANPPRRRLLPALAVLAVSGLVLSHPACVPRRSETSTPPLRASPYPSEPRFEGEFEALLRGAPPASRFVALIDLTEQVDLEALSRALDRRRVSKAERRRAVIDALEEVAFRQQAAVRGRLDALIDAGRVDWFKGLAIVNRLVIEGSAEGILAVSTWPEVGRVLPEWTSERARSAGRLAEEGSDGPAVEFPSWALEATGARAAWSQGLDGRGVVIATIDTGAYGEHEQLRGRRTPGRRGWFDPVQGIAEPYDNHGHGTGVLSVAVGGNPDRRAVGVAPGATWAAALGNWKNFYSRKRMSLAADWALREARPDVLVNAWSHDEGTCERFDAPFIDAWRASGIFVVFPAGNAGPAPASGDVPASLGGVFAVAGLARNGDVLRESSRGPSRCGSDRFPSLAAPGDGLPVAAPWDPRSYAVSTGTSLSAGILGGIAALLLQADPELLPADLERALTEATRDLPPPGFDDDTGAGVVNAAAAIDRIRARAPQK